MIYYNLYGIIYMNKNERKNTMKKLFFVLLVLICLISSCKKTEVNKYTVIFNNDGEVYKEVVYEENEYVEFDTLTKEGHTFLGWSLNGEIVDVYGVFGYTVNNSNIVKLYFTYNGVSYQIWSDSAKVSTLVEVASGMELIQEEK